MRQTLTAIAIGTLSFPLSPAAFAADEDAETFVSSLNERHDDTLESGIFMSAPETEETTEKNVVVARHMLTRETVSPVSPITTVDIERRSDDAIRRIARLATISGGVERARVPVTGIGFVRDGAPGVAPEFPAITSPRTITIMDFAGSLALDKFQAAVSYAKGDGHEVASIRGLDTGIVYGALSPSGSSGIAGVTEGDGSMAYNFESYSLGANYRLLDTDPFGHMALQAYIEGTWVHNKAKYTGTFGSQVDLGGFIATLAQTRDQKVSEDQFELGLRFSTEFGGNSVRPFVMAYAAGITATARFTRWSTTRIISQVRRTTISPSRSGKATTKSPSTARSAQELPCR